MNQKIVVVRNLNLFPDQVERLKGLGETVFYDDVPSDSSQWLFRVEGADIVCGDYGDVRENIYNTRDKYFSLPFVNIGWLDRAKLKERNISVSNSPGCNALAVSEWIIMMTLVILRRFYEFANATKLDHSQMPDMMQSIAGRKVLILGKGNIGENVGKIFQSFSADVAYYQRGDNLNDKAKAASLIINTLGLNSTTQKILNRDFFLGLNIGSYFITVTSPEIYDGEALIEALDKGIIAGAADDCAGNDVGDTSSEYYLKASAHPKIIVTPHIAFHTDVTARTANDMMIDNIEAWLEGNPRNLY